MQEGSQCNLKYKGVNYIDLSEVSKFKNGCSKGKVDWDNSIGANVRFHIESKLNKRLTILDGVFKIINTAEDKKNLIISFEDNIYEIRKNDIISLKFQGLLCDKIQNKKINKDDDRWIDFSRAKLKRNGLDYEYMCKNNFEVDFKYFDIVGKFKFIENKGDSVIIQYNNELFTTKKTNLIKNKLGFICKEQIYKNKTDKTKSRWVDLENLPLMGNGISWDEVANNNMRINFKYDDIIGHFIVLKHNNPIITILYNNIPIEIDRSQLKANAIGGIINKHNKRLIVGVNDFATIYPEYIHYFKNKNDVYEITCKTFDKKELVCPHCGYEKTMNVNNFIRTGFACPICGDGISVPNKFMCSILKQCNIAFESEKIFEWLPNKRYDFYIPSLNIIIEMHGEQHYKNSFKFKYHNSRTLQEEKDNDKLKKEMALKNGIYKYFEVDCSSTYLNYMKNKVCENDLVNIIDLDKVDWNKCFDYCTSNLIKVACDMKKENKNMSVSDIALKMGVNKHTIRNYLKNGSEIGWCEYDGKEESSRMMKKRTGKNHPNAKSVICVNNGLIFNTITEASEYVNLKGSSHIHSCCAGKRKSAGKHPITGEKLIWEYYN